MKKLFVFIISLMLAQIAFAQTYSYDLEQKAKSGDAEAQFELGSCYHNGRGVSGDWKQAEKWYTKAAEKGNAKAQYELGDHLFITNAYYKNMPSSLRERWDKRNAKAIVWFCKAAKQGLDKAQFCLGECYYNGYGITQDYEQAALWYSKAATQGMAVAQDMLGECYYYGRGVTQNYNLAIEYFQKAADGDKSIGGLHETGALFHLALCYGRGHGVAKDEQRAKKMLLYIWRTRDAYVLANKSYGYYALDEIRRYAEDGDAEMQEAVGSYSNGESLDWTRKAAEQGNVEAQKKLASWYYNGKRVQQDYEQAALWYEKAYKDDDFIDGEYADLLLKQAQTTDAKKQCQLAYLYYRKSDYGQAMLLFKKAADQGNVTAQLKLGTCYYHGRGVAIDYTQAAAWFGKAAEQGNAEAQDWLGFCYFWNLGVAKDYVKAVMWFNRGAAQENARSQYFLGYCYYNNLGVMRDYTQAAAWFNKAAGQGYAPALNCLGECYYYGRGVQQDYEKAWRLFQQVYERDSTNAVYNSNIGECYYYGHGVTLDYTKAHVYFLKAAVSDKPYSHAMRMLAKCYENGRGTIQNSKLAKYWMQQAAKANDDEAIRILQQQDKSDDKPFK